MNIETVSMTLVLVCSFVPGPTATRAFDIDSTGVDTRKLFTTFLIIGSAA